MKYGFWIGCTVLMTAWFFCAHGAMAGPDVPRVRFVVKKFVVEGENPLSESLTREVLEPFTGEHEGLDRLQSAAKALEEVFRKKGYAFYKVVVPPQRVTAGVIRLQVAAFPLKRITVKGNRHFSEKNILSSLPALRPGRSPNTLEVARSLLLANQHPAKRVAVFIRENPAGDGIDARVEARDIRPWQVFTSLSNTGERETGHCRLSLGLQHSNLFHRDHTMTLSYTTSPGRWDDVRQYGAYYRMPLYGPAMGVSLFFTHSRVDQGKIGDFFDVSGKGDFGGITVDHAFLPIGDYSHSLALGLQDRWFKNDTRFTGTPIGQDVRSRPVSLRYSGAWKTSGLNAGFYVEGACNISSGQDNNRAAYEASRAGADAHWYVLRAGGDIDRALPGGWDARARFSAQLTGEPLIPGEQFGLGGIRSVRGLDEREISGDSGYEVSLEVWAPPVRTVRFLGFLDTGQIHLESPHPGQRGAQALTSIGAGLRWQWRRHVSVSLDAALVLDGSETTRSGDGKIHFNILYRF